VSDQLQRTYEHVAWGDATLWNAVLAHAAYPEDAYVRASLHHVHLVQRAFLRVWNGEPGGEDLGDRFESPEAVARWGRETHRSISSFIAGLDRSRLDVDMVVPWARYFVRETGAEATVSTLEETLHQVAAHSTHHRAQINRRLRELGADPPVLDYIYWVWIGRPLADWPV
jgi:uncharacterized damage-inducible protein DinB